MCKITALGTIGVEADIYAASHHITLVEGAEFVCSVSGVRFALSRQTMLEAVKYRLLGDCLVPSRLRELQQ